MDNNMNEEQYLNLGAEFDTRPKQEKENDTKHEELFGASEITVFNTKKEALLMTDNYFKEDQKATSSCVAHAVTLAAGIDNELEGEGYVRLSKAFVYRQRANFPSEGMWLGNAGDILKKFGSPEFEVLPTPSKEVDINNVVITDEHRAKAKKYRSKGYVFPNEKSIDQIAFAANILKKGVLICIYANTAEWRLEYPEIQDPNLDPHKATVRHCICVIPNSAYTENGKKFAIIQDSALFGSRSIRHISEEFLKARNFGAMYLVNLSNKEAEEGETKPSYNFKRNLTMEYRGEDVAKLQECLQYLGFMAKEIDGQPFKPTGYYGGMTKRAVKAFQEAHTEEILKPIGLTQGTGYFGSSTRAWFNKNFN